MIIFIEWIVTVYFRYLIGLVLSVALYMAAWTAMVVDSGGGSVDDILVNSTNSQGNVLFFIFLDIITLEQFIRIQNL